MKIILALVVLVAVISCVPAQANCPVGRFETSRAEVTPQQFLRAHESQLVDSGPAIRRALATGLSVRFPAGDYVVRPDPAATPNLKVRAYALRIPDNAHLVFEPGARIVQAPGASAWLRTVSFENAKKVLVEGQLWVDANARAIAPDNNEHMHGVFFYNTVDTCVESIRSENARGDNVFIGGDDNTEGSRNLWIGTIEARTAGRKNLVLHSVRDVRIDRAILDNRSGGARLFGGRPTGTDGHSFDVEPDNFRGEVVNSASIGELETWGSGNDFSAGTTSRQAAAYRLLVGKFTSRVTPRPGVAAWIQYAVTISIGDLAIEGAGGDTPSEIRYAARLYVDHLALTGSMRGRPLLWIAPGRNWSPVVEFRSATVLNSSGEGIRRGGPAPDRGSN